MFSAADVAAELSLTDALRLSAWIGCSLEWLAGLTRKIGPPPDPALVDATRLDTELVRSQRVALDIAEAALRGAVGLQLGPYRRLMKRERQPTVREIADLAGTLRLDVRQLISY